MKQELGVEAALVKGSGGIFVVHVDGKTVAQKAAGVFPTEKDIVAAVRAAG